MRSKTPLALMEQLVMVLVFALAAALCLRLFSFSQQISRRNEAVDRAVTECQRTAELLKAAEIRPAVSGGAAVRYYDDNWNEQNGPDDTSAAVYSLTVTWLPQDIPGLGSARISACRMDSGEELFALTASWQEVDSNG